MRVFLILGFAFLSSSWAMTVPENPEALRMVTRGMNLFAKKFYTDDVSDASKIRGIRQKSVKDKDDNFVMSPAGISIVTSMASFGAGGTTKTQIQTALNLPTDDHTARSGIKSMMDQGRGLQSIELKMANKIFTTTGVEMKPEFKEITKKTFNSEAQSMDFTKPEATETINAWAAEKTNNKIQNLLQPDDIKDASMVLANAVYFKGKWMKPFNAQMTMPKKFHMDDQTSKDVPMMSKMDNMFYAELPDMQAKIVELPYEREKDSPNKYVSMFIIVPNEVNGLKDIEKNMETINMDMVRKHGSMRDVILDMPKFKMESTNNLRPVMEEMGMTDMFSDKADFTGITDSPPLKISKAMQKAMIDVNEEGSEAAAVTTMIAVPMSMPMPQELPVTLTIDRPFYFSIVIVNNELEGGQARTMLFTGRVMDPTSN